MAEELEQKAEEYVKKDGTEAEKILNSVKLSLTREEANVLINCIKQSFKDGYKSRDEEVEQARDIISEYLRLKTLPCASGNSVNMLSFQNTCARAERFLKGDKEN